MVELTAEQKTFLKNLKMLSSATEEDIKEIYTIYRLVINKPEIVDEYLNCNCPSLIRDMAFELVIYYMKNKEKIDAKR
jgi:hypothetical protein